MRFSYNYFNRYNSLISIEIDDYLYFFDYEVTIFQACLEKNIILPRFCYHNKLSIAGNCRICSVEDKKSEKIILACSTLINEEIEILTSTFLVLQARENVIEYLLTNHPLDCPICDQGGECDLQDQAMLFGGDIGRFYETFKRAVENKNFSPLIKFSLNRCIHCARCTRYFLEISNSFLFSLLGRGAGTEISFYDFSLLNDETSGNVIDLCPVGALTSKPYSFIGRIWEYTSIFFVDIFDDFLSNIRVDIRGVQIVRVLPDFNYSVNDEWISDKIRFNYDSYLRERLTLPFFTFFNKYYFFSWLNSLFFIKKYLFLLINFYLSKKKKNYFFNFAFDRFNDAISSFFIKNFSQFFGLNFLYLNSSSNFKTADLRLNYINNIKIDEFDLMKDTSLKIDNAEEITNAENVFVNFFLILMNLNLRYESPIYNLKFKKILKNNNSLILNFGSYNYFNFHSLGFNYFSFFKNFIFFASFFSLNSSIIFFLGTSFFYNNNKIINILLIFKNFFYKIFNFLVYFNYATCLANRVLNYELNVLNKKNFLKFNYFNINPFIFYNFDLNKIDFNFTVSMHNLFIYQGHHTDNFIRYSSLVFPSTIFIEKSDLLINTEGYFRFFYYNYFKYFLGSIKNAWSTLLVFFKLLNIFYTYNFNYIIFFLNKISPIFNNKNNNSFIYDNNLSFFAYSKYLIDYLTKLNGIFFFFINDFYLSDTISRHSLIMSMCSKKYTIFNDFKNFFNNLFF